MQLKILTENPHSEDDLIAKKPILWRLGEIDLTFPLFSYRDYTDFERGLKALSAQSLVGREFDSSEEIKMALTQIHGRYTELRLFGDLILPRFILQFAEPVDKPGCVEILNGWIMSNVTKTHLWVLDDDCPSSDLKMALVDYLANNFDIIVCYELFMTLLHLQTKIKKKVSAILTKAETNETPAQLPQSQVTRTMWEYRQRKLLRRQAMLSSSK